MYTYLFLYNTDLLLLFHFVSHLSNLISLQVCNGHMDNRRNHVYLS